MDVNMVNGLGTIRMVKKKYEGNYENGLQAGKWIYYNEKGVKNMEESYYSCTKECEESHYKHTCPREGKVRDSKKL